MTDGAPSGTDRNERNGRNSSRWLGVFAGALTILAVAAVPRIVRRLHGVRSQPGDSPADLSDRPLSPGRAADRPWAPASKLLQIPSRSDGPPYDVEIPDKSAEEAAILEKPRHGFLSEAVTVLILLGILAVGAYLRLTGVNWDSLTHLHPDERFITMVENSLAWPKSLGEYFDSARSPLNPYNRGYNSFVYGTFPLFLVKGLGIALDMQGYDQIHLVGRVVSAFFDLGSVLLVFFIGLRLFGRGVGLLSALLAAAAVSQVQQAHFFTFDTFVEFFLLAALLFAVRIWQKGEWYDYLLLGASLGLATACKINSALFAVIVLIVAFKQLREVTLAYPNNRMGEWVAVVGRFSFAALAGFLVFRIVEPYAFTGPGFFNIGLSAKFLNDMGYVQKLVSGEIDQPPSVQWAGTTPYLFPLRNLVLWGMGLPFGVAGWAGLVFGAYQLWRRRDTRYLLLVGWVAFFFLYQGGQFAKTMRYFLPIIPLLAVLASQMLAEGYGWARAAVASGSRTGMLPRLALYGVPAIGAVVAVSTLLYAFAFINIYTRPLTRIEATEWIFANVPQGTAIANEHWDDPLPIRWKDRDAGWYRGTMLDLYNDDTPEKFQKLTQQLDQTEYIFLSSNRLYGSIPRMPMKYPMTTEYYRLLFSGELGFQLTKTFTSHPSLFGVEINDDSAEEIFSVYDHPKVLIFRKTPDYSPAKTRQMLGAVPLDRVLPVKSVEAGYNGLLLSDADSQTQQSGGTWSAMFDRGGITNRLPVVWWLLALELLGLLALPLAWRLFGRFRDCGYGLAKTVGLLLVAYVAWLLPSLRLAEFGPGSILIGLALLGAVSALLLRGRVREFAGFVVSYRGVILLHELVFLAAFGLMALVRASNPDLWHPNFGGEKPMEFAYLNAVVKSTYFPPYDPWLAGGYINYYYFGFVIVATLIRLTGIVPAVAFNLAIPTVFALTAAGLFSFGLNFGTGRRLASRVATVRSISAGLAAVLFVLIAGNLDGAIQRLEQLWAISGSQFKSTIPGLEGLVRGLAGLGGVLLGGKMLPPLDFWRSTRIVGGAESPTPIMEFPYFTFLYGDLHPHMISMPIAALALCLSLAIVWQGKGHKAVAPSGTSKVERGLLILFGGLVVGVLQATNSWDYPTYLVVLSAAFLVAVFARDRALTLLGTIEAAFSAGLTYVVAQLLFFPYTHSYQLFYNGVDPAPAKTDIRYYVIMFGFFLFSFGVVLALGLARNRWHRFRLRGLYERVADSKRWERRRELWRAMVRPSPWMELLPWGVAVLVAVATVALLARQYLIALLVLICLLALLSLFQRDISPERMLLALLVGLGAVLTLAVEFVTLKGDIGRMNTVFKFYLQAWFLFGLASAALVTTVLWKERTEGVRRPWAWRRIFLGGVAVLLMAVLVYPLGATPTKVGMRFHSSPPTLDGMAYMETAVLQDQNRDVQLGGDYEALLWLQDHIAGSPTVLEAQIPEYRWGSRVSIYTGLPTVLGWTWHQRQQRGSYGWMIDRRLADIKTMFDSANAATASALMRRYDVRLIYVGGLERAYYSAAGLAKFDQMVASGDLSVIYRANGVTVYEVKSGNRPDLVISTPARPGGG